MEGKKPTIKWLIKGAGIVMASLLVLTCPLYAQRTISVIVEDHWVPRMNPEFKKQIEEWGAQRGVKTRIDFVGTRVSAVKLAAELASRKGHDLITLHFMSPGLYKDELAPLDDIAEELGRKYGPWSESARYLCFLDGHWRALPSHHEPTPANINTRYWREIGFEPDEVGELTWDSFLEAAKKLKAIGHPVGCALSPDYDATNFLSPLLWSFGGRTVDKQGNIVVDSMATKNMLEYVEELYPYMPPEVTGWLGADNNLFMHSGTGSWTSNGPTIWGVAKMKELPILSDLDHVPFLSGPAGRFTSQAYSFWGIWEFSPNIDLAKDLLKFLMTKENYYKQIAASWGVYLPDLKAYEAHPIWREIHASRHFIPAEKIGEPHPFGWSAPPGPGSALEVDMGLLGVTAAKVVTGEASVSEAIAWLEHRLEMVYKK